MNVNKRHAVELKNWILINLNWISDENKRFVLGVISYAIRNGKISLSQRECLSETLSNLMTEVDHQYCMNLLAGVSNEL